MTNSRARLAALALGGLGVGVCALLALPAQAVNTRSFSLDSAADLYGGELDRVAVIDDGSVVLGVDTERMAPPDQVGSVWSMLDLGDGSVLAGTGVDGRIYRIRGRDVSLYAETGEVVVASLARDPSGAVFAGTLPEGKVFRVLPPQGNTPQRPTLVAALPGARHVWAMTWDASRRALLCATGPEGKLFAVDPSAAGNNATVLFDAEQEHLTTMTLGPENEVVLGSSGGAAVLYGVRGPGRARVIARLTGDEVKGVVVAGDSLVAISNEIPEGPDPPRRTLVTSRQPTPGGPTAARPRPGRGALWRVRSGGFAERIAIDNRAHYTALAWDESRREALVALAINGQVLAVGEDRTQRMVFDVGERSVTSFVTAGGALLFGTADSGAFYRALGPRPAGASWTSRVLDANLPARWGAVRWRGVGALDWEARSGNHDLPDATWSAWTALDADGVIRAPGGRYVQVRARFSRDPATVLRSVTVYYLPENQRAVLTEVTASRGESKADDTRPPPLRVAWKVDNPDSDELRYRLRFRGDGDETWRPLLRNQEWLSTPNFVWTTEGMPEGWYRVEVEASDEVDNPEDVVTRDRRVSDPVLVDTTAPVVTVRVEAGRLRGEVRDGASAVLSLALSVDGGEFRPVRCADGVLDERGEDVDLALPAGLAGGDHVLALRARDEAGNLGVGSVRMRR